MERYTIYCTPEQAKKALELGAPISGIMSSTKEDITTIHCFKLNSPIYSDVVEGGFDYATIPTAEEMIGWLEEQGILIDLHFYCVSWDIGVRTKTGHIVSQRLRIESRKEATLAAIDAALEYISDEKIKH